MIYELFVEGVPVPQGSMSAFPYEDEDEKLHVRQTHSRKDLTPWRDLIGYCWRTKYGFTDLDEPLFMALLFYVPTPKKLERTYPDRVGPGDLDKLARGVYDALEKIAYVNDARVVVQIHRKVYANSRHDAGVQIVLAPWSEVATSDLMGLFRGEGIKR